MYLSASDIANLKIYSDARTVRSEMVSELITSDSSSAQKLRMNEGVRYYEGQHDILDKQRKYWLDGREIVDAAKSNEKVPHPFFQLLLDQKVQYIAGNPIVLGIKKPDVVDEENPTPDESTELALAEAFKTSIDEVIGESFDDVISDWLNGQGKKGVEYVHFYLDPKPPEDGSAKLNYLVIPAEQCIPIYNTQYQDKLVMMIRYYTYQFIDEKSVAHNRYKVEFWTADDVTYFVEDINHNFAYDTFYQINPAGHWHSYNTQKPDEKVPHGWGRVPFIELANNSQRRTDLENVKALIDVYDKIVSGWADDVNDFAQMIYVLRGYVSHNAELEEGVNELSLIVQNMKAFGVAPIEGADGGIDVIRAEIPTDAKERLLNITRKAIYSLGQGVDVDDEKLGNSSGVALKFVYQSLDIKAKKAITKLMKALREFAWFITEFINLEQRKQYDYKQIDFTYKLSTIFNEAEIINNLNSSKISQRTYLENHPYIEDAEAEEARLESEKATASGNALADNLGKLPLAIQQLALARTRAIEVGDKSLAEIIGNNMERLTNDLGGGQPTNGQTQNVSNEA